MAVYGNVALVDHTCTAIENILGATCISDANYLYQVWWCYEYEGRDGGTEHETGNMFRRRAATLKLVDLYFSPWLTPHFSQLSFPHVKWSNITFQPPPFSYIALHSNTVNDYNLFNFPFARRNFPFDIIFSNYSKNVSLYGFLLLQCIIVMLAL